MINPSFMLSADLEAQAGIKALQVSDWTVPLLTYPGQIIVRGQE